MMKKECKLILLLIQLAYIGLFIGCKKDQTFEHVSVDASEDYFTKDSTKNNDTILLVMKNPDSTQAQFDEKIKRVQKDFPPINIKQYCPCSSTLIEMYGKGVSVYKEELTSKGGTTSGTARKGGDDGPLIWSVDVNVNFTDIDSKGNLNVSTPNYTSANNSIVTVAVLDTGIDPSAVNNGHKKRFANSMYENFMASCLGKLSNNGWNFPGKNNNWRDNEDTKHGTAVSAFIEAQMHDKVGLGQVRLLPVKVLKNSGTGKLSDILCGMAYAKERGAKIINVSLGYYTHKTWKDIYGNIHTDSSGYLLKTFIEQNLTPENILVVCAAGNDDSAISWDDKRNLDKLNFFPASLASNLRNVIAVTTVNGTQVDPFQNYSNKVVDIGVLADDEVDFYFSNPLYKEGYTKRGSSFAAPIVSGKLCAYYKSLLPILQNGRHFDKSEIWNTLAAQNVVFRNPMELSDQINNNGLYTKK